MHYHVLSQLSQTGVRTLLCKRGGWGGVLSSQQQKHFFFDSSMKKSCKLANCKRAARIASNKWMTRTMGLYNVAIGEGVKFGPFLHCCAATFEHIVNQATERLWLLCMAV